MFAHNDRMALAARDAIERRDTALVNRIHFVGVDGLLGDGLGVESVARGKLDASFYYPTGGGVAIKVAWLILSGEPFSKRYTLNTAMIDKTNAGTLYLQSDRLTEYQRQIEKQTQEIEIKETNHLICNLRVRTCANIFKFSTLKHCIGTVTIFEVL